MRVAALLVPAAPRDHSLTLPGAPHPRRRRPSSRAPRHAQARFLTRIWHPQVEYATGKPCLDVLARGWKPTMNLHDVLVTLRQFIASPGKGAWRGGAGRGGGAWGGAGWGRRARPLMRRHSFARASVLISLPFPAPRPHHHCAEDFVNHDAGGELVRSVDEFDKHAREETQKWACDE